MMSKKHVGFESGRAGRNAVFARHRKRGIGTKGRGSVLIEAALVSVFVLIPLTLAIIQYGIVFNATNTLSQVTREGGRAAAVFALKTSAQNPGVGMDADTYIRSRIEAAAASTSLAYDDMKDDIVITPAMGTPARAKGQPIKVSISYAMRKKYFFPWLTGGRAGDGGDDSGFVAMPARITRTATLMIE